MLDFLLFKHIFKLSIAECLLRSESYYSLSFAESQLYEALDRE